MRIPRLWILLWKPCAHVGEKGARRKPHSPFLQISTLQAIYLSENWIFPVGEPSPLSFSTTSVYICNIVQEESRHIQLNMPFLESRTGLLVVAMHYHCSSSPSFIHWWWCCMQWIFIIIGKPVPTYIVEECRQAMVGVEWRMMKQGIRWGADTRRTDSI